MEGGRTALDNKTSLLNTPSPRSFAVPRSREFAPYGYGDTISAYDKSALKEAVFDDDVEQFRDCESIRRSKLIPSLSQSSVLHTAPIVCDCVKKHFKLRKNKNSKEFRIFMI